MATKKMTKKDIENLAKKIIEVCCEHGLGSDMGVYFNNKRIWVRADYRDIEKVVWETEEEENIDPHDYFTYAAYNHIISISTEGGLYDSLNYGSGEFPKELEQLFDEWGIYYEFGDSWNLSFFPIDEDKVDIEYTVYKKPVEPTYIYLTSEGRGSPATPPELVPLMREWWQKSKETGDIGGCVIGAKMRFTYNDIVYHMHPCSPWQGEWSWTAHVEWMIDELKKLGATDVNFYCGCLD